MSKHRMAKNYLTRHLIWISTLGLAMLLAANDSFAQTTAFTYQGKLTDGGNAANGNYDLQFALFDSASGGSQIGSTLSRFRYCRKQWRV